MLFRSVCVHVFVFVCMCSCLCACVRVCVHVSVFVCMCPCLCVEFNNTMSSVSEVVHYQCQKDPVAKLYLLVYI